jgi:arylsulfatase A-like enzyme
MPESDRLLAARLQEAFAAFLDHTDAQIGRVVDALDELVQAGNTPFKWYKQNTHEGGVHVPLIVHWPATIDDAGGLRDQFHHVNDIVPAIYADGWKAVTRHQPGVAFDDDTWELYHLAEDRSETVDLAVDRADKLAELIDLWWLEADEHGVLPLDDRTIELFGARFRDRSPTRR